MSRCDCEPIEYDDGSKGHEYDCPAFPWCPHEIGVAACSLPCPCRCSPCQDLGAEA